MTMQRDSYWSQWSNEDRELWGQIKRQIEWSVNSGSPQSGTFTEMAPGVPEWLRTATAGILRRPESPKLQLARVWDPLDWPTLLEEHPEELHPCLPGPRSLRWNGIAHAYRLLQIAGYQPYLDVDLDVGAGKLWLTPTELRCRLINPSIHSDLSVAVTAALGGEILYQPKLHGFDDAHGWEWISGFGFVYPDH